MNHIFRKTVGGVLKDNLPICHEKNCHYKMNLKIEGVKELNIESFLIDEIEVLNAVHYEGYYDKSYTENEMTIYKLPYTEDIRGLDVSITLVPVNGQGNLYINPKSRPLQLEGFNWKETGSMAKKITISASELAEM